MERHGISFDRTVNIVDDFGADPNGGSAINGALDRAVESNTLVIFPEGQYKLNETFEVTADRVGFLGQGNVVLEPDGISGKTIVVNGRDEFLFEGIDLDVSGARNTGLRVHSPSKFHVEDVKYLGRGGRSGQAFHLAVNDESGLGRIRNVTVKHGGYMDLYWGGDGRIGVWAGSSHRGTIRFTDCEFSEFGNNGMYTSRTPGDIQVENSYFENNNVCGVRISGAGSWVRDSTFVVDHSRYGPDFEYTDNAFNTRAIRLDQAKNGTTIEKFPPKTDQTDPSAPDQERGVVVENCDVQILDTVTDHSCRGAIVMNAASQSATIRDSHIRVDVDDVPAIYRVRPGWNFRDDQSTPPKPHWVIVKNVTITGSAAGGHAVRVENGDNSIVRDSCFQQSGSGRNGVFFKNTAGALVEKSNIKVAGEAVASDNSDVTTRDLTYGEQCPIPETGRNTDSSTPSETTYDHEITVKSDRDADVFGYTVNVTGDAEAVTSGTDAANLSDGDAVTTTDGGLTRIEGKVGQGGGDTYRFNGEIVTASVDGAATVLVDGAEVTVSKLGLTHRLDVVGSGVETATYEFDVDGTLVRSGDDDDALVADGSASGSVESDTHTYYFDGSITGFSRDDQAGVVLDGEQVDPAGLGTETDASLPNRLTIDGTDSDGSSTYTFEVTGEIEKSYQTGSIETDDDITDGRISGSVTDDIDAYRFSGDIRMLDMTGNGSIHFQDADGTDA